MTQQLSRTDILHIVDGTVLQLADIIAKDGHVIAMAHQERKLRLVLIAEHCGVETNVDIVFLFVKMCKDRHELGSQSTTNERTPIVHGLVTYQELESPQAVDVQHFQ